MTKKSRPEIVVPKPVRVLVYGGRDFSEMVAFEWLVRNGERIVREMLGPEAKVKTIINGGAEGADKAGARWGRFLGVKVETFGAEFSYIGKGAGPIRNKVMADHARIDCGIEFPGDVGTRDMRLKLAGRDIPYFQVKVKETER